jgi:hypothetical protein
MTKDFDYAVQDFMQSYAVNRMKIMPLWGGCQEVVAHDGRREGQYSKKLAKESKNLYASSPTSNDVRACVSKFNSEMRSEKQAGTG